MFRRGRREVISPGEEERSESQLGDRVTSRPDLAMLLCQIDSRIHITATCGWWLVGLVWSYSLPPHTLRTPGALTPEMRLSLKRRRSSEDAQQPYGHQANIVSFAFPPTRASLLASTRTILVVNTPLMDDLQEMPHQQLFSHLLLLFSSFPAEVVSIITGYKQYDVGALAASRTSSATSTRGIDTLLRLTASNQHYSVGLQWTDPFCTPNLHCFHGHALSLSRRFLSCLLPRSLLTVLDNTSNMALRALDDAQDVWEVYIALPAKHQILVFNVKTGALLRILIFAWGSNLPQSRVQLAIVGNNIWTVIYPTSSSAPVVVSIDCQKAMGQGFYLMPRRAIPTQKRPMTPNLIPKQTWQCVSVQLSPSPIPWRTSTELMMPILSTFACIDESSSVKSPPDLFLWVLDLYPPSMRHSCWVAATDVKDHGTSHGTSPIGITSECLTFPILSLASDFSDFIPHSFRVKSRKGVKSKSHDRLMIDVHSSSDSSSNPNPSSDLKPLSFTYRI